MSSKLIVNSIENTTGTHTINLDSGNSSIVGDLTVGGNLDLSSGGVYLGGSGSANLLDDYETGTWTGNCSTGSCSVLNENYIKVGNLVTAVCRAESFTDTSSSANVNITGLPYAAANGDFTGAIIAKGLSNTNLSACYTGAGQSSVSFYGVHSGGFLALRHLDLTSTTQIYFTLTYTTS